MTDQDHKPAIERAVELMVYAPIGLALFARDMVPPLLNQFVTRGRARVEELQHQVENHLGQARIIGQFAVSQGAEQVRREVGNRIQEARDRGEQLARSVGVLREAPPEPEPPSRVHAAPSHAAPSGNGSRTSSDHLPIPDYDELSASQVVARLAGLDREELKAVRQYEETQRQRKTILTKIEQLIA